MNPALSLLVYSVALAVIAGFGYLWYQTTPTKGSGWALFACIFVSVCMNSPADIFVSTFVYGTMSVGFGVGWYLTRNIKDSGWLLAVSILSALTLVDKLF